MLKKSHHTWTCVYGCGPRKIDEKSMGKNRKVLGCTCQQPSEASPCKAAQCNATSGAGKGLELPWQTETF